LPLSLSAAEFDAAAATNQVGPRCLSPARRRQARGKSRRLALLHRKRGSPSPMPAPTVRRAPRWAGVLRFPAGHRTAPVRLCHAARPSSISSRPIPWPSSKRLPATAATSMPSNGTRPIAFSASAATSFRDAFSHAHEGRFSRHRFEALDFKTNADGARAVKSTTGSKTRRGRKIHDLIPQGCARRRHPSCARQRALPESAVAKNHSKNPPRNPRRFVRGAPSRATCP